MAKKKCIDCGTENAMVWHEQDGFIHKWYQCQTCRFHELQAKRQIELPIPDYNPVEDLTEDTHPIGFNLFDLEEVQ